MTRIGDVDETASPFLLEALEAFQPGPQQSDLVPRFAAVARRLSGPARRHVERSLVRQLVDTGIRDRRVLAAAVASLRRALAEEATSEAETAEVVEEELATHDPGECECGGTHEVDKAEEAEACEADETDETVDDNEAYGAADEGVEAGEDEYEDGEEHEADEEREDAQQYEDEQEYEDTEQYEGAEAHEDDEQSDADGEREDGERDGSSEAYEAMAAHDSEGAAPLAFQEDEADDETLAGGLGPLETQDHSEQSFEDAPDESESPSIGESSPRPEEAAENLAGFNEMFERAGIDDEAEDEEEAEEAYGDQAFEAAPAMEAEAPTSSEIQSSLDAIVVSSKTETLRRAPNPFDLNAVASKNTESKRGVFMPLQRTWHQLTAAEARIIAKGSTKALEQKRATLTKRLTDQAAAVKQWLRSHPLDHSRSRAQLVKDIAKHARGLRKLKGAARAAAEGAHSALEEMLKTLEKSLRAAAEAYEPLKDFQRKRHEVRVPSAAGVVVVRLHDHVIAFATDTAGGLDGNADGDSEAEVTAALARSGVSPDKQAILQIVSSLEGRFSTVNTWDRAVVTFGFTQWTTGASGDGTLCKLMDAIRSASAGAYRRCFQRYGLDLDKKLRFQVTLPDGRVLVGGEAARHVQTSVKQVAAISAAGMDPDVQTAQIRFAVARKIDAMRAHVLSAGGRSARLGDLLTSEYAVAVMTDRAVGTGEHGTRDAANRAFAAYVKASPDADFSESAHREAAAGRVLSAIEALDRGRASKYATLSRDPGSFAG